MKRLLSSVIAFLCVVSATSCNSPMNSQTKRENNLASPFTAKMSVNLDKLTAEGTITRNSNKNWVAEFESPNTLSGVKLAFEENVVKASYKGLDFSVPKSAIPVKAMLTNLMEAVDSLASQETLTGTENEGLLQISGNLEGGDYCLSIDENGNIHTFEMPNNLLKITFSDVVLNAATPSHTDTTLSSAVTTEFTVTTSITTVSE